MLVNERCLSLFSSFAKTESVEVAEESWHSYDSGRVESVVENSGGEGKINVQ